MKTLESFLSENQELLKPVGLDECAALNGGTAPACGRGHIWGGNPPRLHIPLPSPVPVSPFHL